MPRTGYRDNKRVVDTVGLDTSAPSRPLYGP